MKTNEEENNRKKLKKRPMNTFFHSFNFLWF
jgi:hypothetical protein